MFSNQMLWKRLDTKEREIPSMLVKNQYQPQIYCYTSANSVDICYVIHNINQTRLLLVPALNEMDKA